MAKIRILLADDHAVLRAGLRLLIDSQPDLAVIGEAATAPEAVTMAAGTRPDVVLLDITMPGESGMQAIGRIRQESRRTRVLVLTMHDDPAYARAALAAGGSGLIVKDAQSAELLAAIRAVHRGRTLVDLPDPGIGDQPATGAPPPPARPDHVPGRSLSRRERQVLQLVAQGYTNQQVAGRLTLSTKTVEGYRARLGEKLGLRGRADLVRFALETGLLGPGSTGDRPL
jgi:DNA-binding NarL/FixJ family response regulator